MRDAERSEEVALLRLRYERFAKEFGRHVAHMERVICAESDESETMPLPSLSERQNEICLPLLAIAKVLGVETETKEMLVAAFTITQKATSDRDEQFFTLIHEAFGEESRISTKTLLDVLGPIYDDRSLAALLRPHGIGPVKIRTEEGPSQGYRADRFREMWSRYNLNGHHAESEPIEDAA